MICKCRYEGKETNISLLVLDGGIGKPWYDLYGRSMLSGVCGGHRQMAEKGGNEVVFKLEL